MSPTKMCIKSAPCLQQKRSGWGLNIMLILILWCINIINPDANFAPNKIKLVPNSTKKAYFLQYCRNLVQIRYNTGAGTKMHNFLAGVSIYLPVHYLSFYVSISIFLSIYVSTWAGEQMGIHWWWERPPSGLCWLSVLPQLR